MASDAPTTNVVSGATLIPFPVKRRLRADVPAFDPANPAHIAAWEAIYDMGRAELRRVAREGR